MEARGAVDILVIMCIGIVAGRLLVPASLKRANELLQTVCTALLIFAMGISLGGNDDFFANLGTLGLQSLLFCLLPMIGSIAVVYPLTSWLMGDGFRGEQGDAGEGRASSAVGRSARKDSIGSRIASLLHEESMAVIAFIALFAGIALGYAGSDIAALRTFASYSDLILDVLMFSVGISVGLRRGLVASIREHHIKTLVIPLGVIAGSLVGGLVAALLTGIGPREGMAVASALGWYSLAGVTIEGMAGAQLGGIAFLSSLMREIVSFFSIPGIAKHFNYYSCIAAGAATSEDTTLPMMIRYTDERTVVFSLVNGIICSTCVPFLIALFLG